jgi:TMEM175 potassium channel family protein
MGASRPSDAKDREDLSFERLVFFSDAVFAIAITLLAMEVRLPEGAAIADGRDLGAALWSLLPRYLGFLVSFVVIGSLWVSHHRMFRVVRGFDGVLVFLDLVFLLFVAFIPFPTSILGRYGIIPEAEAFYAAWMAAAGLAKLAIWLHASRRGRLLAPGIGPDEVRGLTFHNVVPACLIIASIPIAWAHWLAPMLVWIFARPLTNLAWRLLVGRPRPDPVPAPTSSRCAAGAGRLPCRR